jgi:hypothetical protein
MGLRIDPDASRPTHAMTAMEHWIVGDLDEVIRDEVDAALSASESMIGESYNRARLAEIIAGRLRWVAVALETRDHMGDDCEYGDCETHALWRRLQGPGN